MWDVRQDGEGQASAVATANALVGAWIRASANTPQTNRAHSDLTACSIGLSGLQRLHTSSPPPPPHPKSSNRNRRNCSFDDRMVRNSIPLVQGTAKYHINTIRTLRMWRGKIGIDCTTGTFFSSPLHRSTQHSSSKKERDLKATSACPPVDVTCHGEMSRRLRNAVAAIRTPFLRRDAALSLLPAAMGCHGPMALWHYDRISAALQSTQSWSALHVCIRTTFPLSTHGCVPICPLRPVDEAEGFVRPLGYCTDGPVEPRQIGVHHRHQDTPYQCSCDAKQVPIFQNPCDLLHVVQRSKIEVACSLLTTRITLT